MTVDCDVIQANGGTRTASITGACVALAMALRKMIDEKKASPRALKTAGAAVSVGIVNGEEMLDPKYAEDSRAQVDFNVVMTAEDEPFAREQMDRLINLARVSIGELMKMQRTGLHPQ